MARSTYISKNLTGSQIAFLKMLDDHEVDFFELDTIEELLGHSIYNLNEIVENLADKELLDRIERGKYTRPNFKDTYVLGTFISPGKAAIAYWSALHLHSLTTRFPNTVFIKTTSQKRSKNIFGVNYKFVKVKQERFIGIMKNGYGSSSYPITNSEMTLIDCFDQPRYGGEFPDLVRALNEAELDQDRMIEYAQVIGNNSMIRRMGYITEMLGKPSFDRFISFAQNRSDKRYILLDPHSPDIGAFNNRWKLRMNVSEESLLEIVSSPF